MKNLALFFIAAIYIPLSIADNSKPNSWKIAKIEYFKEKSTIQDIEVERSVVSFENGKRLIIPLERAKPITVLSGNDGSKFLLAEGADCIECDENIGLRFYELNGSELKPAKNRYAYPGKLYDHMNPDSLQQETRTFYGNCLDESGDVVIWLIKYLGVDSKWHNSNSIVKITKQGDVIAALKTKDVTQASILTTVKNGSCIELTGINGTSEP